MNRQEYDAVYRVIGWLEAQASRNEEKVIGERFLSLKQAYIADAKNYRAMAKDLRAVAILEKDKWPAQTVNANASNYTHGFCVGIADGANKMKAISMSRPWAFVVAKGWKDIENRKWYLPTKIADALPVRIYIHAAKSFDHAAPEFIRKNLTEDQLCEFWKNKHDIGIIGEVTITACVRSSNSPWFFGPWGFILEAAVLCDQPIPYKGSLGFFEVKLP